MDSAKYAYKLRWLEALRDHVREELKIPKKLVIVGDFNIAPEDRDVYDPKAWEGNVLTGKPNGMEGITEPFGFGTHRRFSFV